MADIAPVFDEYLRSLSEAEWDALTKRVRASAAPPPQPPLPGERVTEPDLTKFTNAGLAEARRRGYVDADGKPVTR